MASGVAWYRYGADARTVLANYPQEVATYAV